MASGAVLVSKESQSNDNGYTKQRVRITISGAYERMRTKYKGIAVEVVLRNPKLNGYNGSEVMAAIVNVIVSKLEEIVNTLRLATFADSISISVSGVYGKDYA